jgi:hypothetical protein
MAFTHSDKVPGDPIRSADWNDMGREVARLEGAKVDLAPAQTQTLNGALVIKAGLEVGTGNTGAQLRIFRRQENAADPANQGALVVGNDNATSATLRLGYDQNYSWLQGQGRQNLALNPRGGDVGVGTDAPKSRLSVAGGVAVGAAYAGASAAPASSLIVEGSLGVGTPAPGARLHVEGNARVNGGLDVTGALNFGTAVRQMVNLWGTGYGVGVQSSTTYFRSDAHFAFFRGGTHADAQLAPGPNGVGLMSILNSGNVGIGTMDPQARLHVAGGALRLDAGQEIVFADNGQIRSIDNNHRILFRRSEDKLELREYGDIVFSPGATAGAETAKAVLKADGSFGIGTAAPRSALDTFRGVMSGAANDYVKAQFTMSGGGVVTWVGGRLKWTQRFIAISANRGTTFSAGYVDINMPTAGIPAANVYNNTARSATADGVALGAWEALYAVHTPGGDQGAVSFRIVIHTADFNAPSNWILVGVVNGDANFVKLGTGESAGRWVSALDVSGALSFGNAVRQMVNLWGTGYGIGVQNATAYFRSDAHFGFYRGGTHSDAQLTPGAGGVGLMSILNNGSVGIGTMSPGARLQVVDGAIMPAAGDSDAAGIMFPRDAFGGGGDAAWIRWVSRGGESTTLEIGCANDGDDHIALNPAGNVGIGTRSPESKLHVATGEIRWGNGSLLSTDQGGSIELGGNNGKAGTGVPFIDFHHGNGRIEDYNARIINDGDGVLTVFVRTFRYNGNVVMASSRELKDGIEELGVDEAQRIVSELNPVRYHMKNDEMKEPHLGFIAEDVPEQVAALDRKAISPNHIIAALTRVVKEQQRRIDELARRINGEAVNA